jgi:hypothetical protein
MCFVILKIIVSLAEQSPELLTRDDVNSLFQDVLSERSPATGALLSSLAHFLKEEDEKILRSQREQQGSSSP